MNLQQNYFELFSLDVSARIDKQDLAIRYRELQRTVHPDRFVSGTEQEQRLSLQYTTLINQAYEVLCSDLKRCIYLLKLQGIEISETENTAVEPAFLMQQIELREMLEEIDQSESSLGELDSMRNKVNDVLSALIEEFISVLDTDSSPELAIPIIRKMQYMTKLVEEIELQEEELLDYQGILD